MELIREAYIFFSFFFALSPAANLPPPLTKCPLGDDTCLAAAVENAIKFFANGHRGLGIIPVDPLAVHSLIIGAGQAAVNVEQRYTNVLITGLSSAKVTYARYDDDIKQLVLKGDFLNDLVMQGDYEMNGKILLLPVEGRGPFKITMAGLSATATFQFKEVINKGKKYLEIENLKLDLHPSRIYFQFENLFNGNKELSDSIHKAVDESWKEVFEDIQPGLEGAFEEILGQISANFFKKVPKEEVFS